MKSGNPLQNEIDNSGIKAIEEQDLGTVEVNPNAQNKPSAFPQFTDEAKVSRGLEDFTKFKKGFKQALPYVLQLGADLVPGSGITEISGQQIDVVEGGKRPSFVGQVERTTELAKEGKTTEAIVSGVDTLLTGAAGVGEGMMVAGAIAPSIYGKALSIAGWGFYGLAKGGSAILRNTKTGKKILADFEGDDAVGYDIKSIKIPENVESDDTIKTLEDNIDIETVRTDDTDTEVAIPEIAQDLDTTEAITGYVVAPDKLSRNELMAKIENDPEVKTKTDKYLNDQGFTEDTVPVYRVISVKDKMSGPIFNRKVSQKAQIGDESIISGSLSPEANLRTINYFDDKGATKQELVRYDVPRDKIKLTLKSYKDNIKQSSNKKIKDKGFGQEKIKGYKTVTNPSKTAKELIEMQDEVIADVTGLEKISFGKPDAMELRALPKILKGEIKSAKEYKEYYKPSVSFASMDDFDKMYDKKISVEEFRKIEDAKANQAYDKVTNFYKLGAPKQDEGIKSIEQKDITPSALKFEPADPKGRRMYGRTYISEDESLGLIEIGVDGYTTKRLYAVNAMVDGKPRNIGKVTLNQSTVADDKKIDDLINIELNDDVRGKGFGEKIIKGLVNYSSRPEGLSIRDIKRNALPFWKKLGINFYEGSINRASRYKKYGFIPNESGMKNVKYKDPSQIRVRIKQDEGKQDEGIKALGPRDIKKRERVGTTGQYIGAPKGLDSPQKLSSIRRKLKALAVGGQEGRFWYEKSGKEILEATGGDVNEADKIIQAIAITSPQTPVKTNFDYAIQAYNQYKASQPIKTGRFPTAMVPKLEEVFAGKNWEGRKTDDFYNNLMVHIDPDRVGPVTGDIWMLRALGFAKENEMPSPEQYKFVTKEIQKLSKELGWEPQQTQAAIWVNFKARSENPDVKKRTMEKSLKKGFIKYEKNKKGKNVVKYLNKPEHMKLWFKESFGYEPTTADLKKAGFDYSEALRQSLGQISWEAVPHSSTNHLKGLETGEPKIKSEYHTDISKAFLDDRGRDIIAQRLGLLSPGEFEAPGYYMGIVNPGSQTEVVMPKGYKTGKSQKIEKSTEDLIEAYAIARGILMKQEMVGWHRPFYNATIKESNGLDLNLGRQFNLDEIGDLSKEIQKVVDKEVKLIQQTDPNFKGPSFEIAPVSTGQGVRLINFEEVFDNQQFQKIIIEANNNFVKKLDKDSNIDVKLFSAQKGDYSNNWKEFKNGEGYLQRLSKEGRSDLYRKVRGIIDEIQPRIDDVDTRFSEKYGFNFNSEINSAYRGEGQLDEGVRVTVDDTPTVNTDPLPTKPEPTPPIKKSFGGFVEKNTYDWVYRDG